MAEQYYSAEAYEEQQIAAGVYRLGNSGLRLSVNLERLRPLNIYIYIYFMQAVSYLSWYSG